MSRAPAARSAGDAADLVLGRFRILRPLGRGGSGSVWLARDEHTSRDVALKVVPLEGKAGTRAEREAVAVSRLRSRYCARAYSVERDDRHVYVAYEYVPGQTLREALRAGQLDDATAVEVGVQVLEALAHAHARRIVHRDVKPANVLLEDGEGVSVRLLDFGLAQLEEAEPLTATGDVPGTLAYIAPERLKGQQATGAADVWSVGVMLWEALAGYQPFATGSPVETARRITDGAEPLASVRPDLPRTLTEAVDHALELDPRRRPTPGELAAELRGSRDEAARRRRERPAVSRRVLFERSGHACLAAIFTAVAAGLLSFYPAAWTPALAVVAALACLLEPRAGLAFALTVPVLPLGDVSLALAFVYTLLAAAWLAGFWGDPRHGLLGSAGPLLAFAGALFLMPLVAERASGFARRFLQAGVAVLLAALVAGLRQAPLPLSEASPPRGLGIAGSESPTAVAGSLERALLAQPAIAIEALLLAAAAAALPLVRRHGLPGIGAFASTLLAAALLAPWLAGGGSVAVVPVVLGVLGLAAALAVPALRARRRSEG